MIKTYNSLSRKIEEFKPNNPAEVKIYTCGPTVYSAAHIGNFRTYTVADLFVRLLRAQGQKVKYVMNITDVGQLTGDNSGDASVGEDRMEVAAKKTGQTAWEIAQHFTDIFTRDLEQLNLTIPDYLVKATDHLQDQINLIKTLEEKGYTYRTGDGIYFNTAKSKNYGQLSTLDQIQEGIRVAKNPEKKNSRDFALWKFSRKDEKRQMEWDSPWGKGFPGWHIECSAMSMKYLGPSLDVHFGGEDLRSTHHPNEMAQSEAATGQQFVKYWIHSAFLFVDRRRMSKSLGNVYTISDLIAKGFDPRALKLFYYSAHYRTPLNFTWEGLKSVDLSLAKIKRFLDGQAKVGLVDKNYYDQFLRALNNDLDTAGALAILRSCFKDGKITKDTKAATILKFDDILGLGLDQPVKEIKAVPKEIQDLVAEREKARENKNWALADQLRQQIDAKGFAVEDTTLGPKVIKK